MGGGPGESGGVDEGGIGRVGVPRVSHPRLTSRLSTRRQSDCHRARKRADGCHPSIVSGSSVRSPRRSVRPRRRSKHPSPGMPRPTDRWTRRSLRGRPALGTPRSLCIDAAVLAQREVVGWHAVPLHDPREPFRRGVPRVVGTLAVVVWAGLQLLVSAAPERSTPRRGVRSKGTALDPLTPPALHCAKSPNGLRARDEDAALVVALRERVVPTMDPVAGDRHPKRWCGRPAATSPYGSCVDRQGIAHP